MGTSCFPFLFLFTPACYGRFCDFVLFLLRLHFYLALHPSPRTSDLYLVTSRTHRDNSKPLSQPGKEANLMGKKDAAAAAAATTLPRWPDFPSLTGELPACTGSPRSRHMPPGKNRIGCVPQQHLDEVTHIHKPSSGWNEWSPARQREGEWATSFCGKVGFVVRSDTLCIFVAPTVPMQRWTGFLETKTYWENPHHQITYTTVTHTHKHSRTRADSHTKSQSINNNLLRRRNRDRATSWGDGERSGARCGGFLLEGTDGRTSTRDLCLGIKGKAKLLPQI